MFCNAALKSVTSLKGLNHWLCLLSDVNVNVNVCLSGSGWLVDRDDVIVLETSRLRGRVGRGADGRKLGPCH
jgi:hypothetical protein